MSIFKKLFGDANGKYLKGIQYLVDEINNLEEKFKSFSDEELKGKTKEFKERIEKGENLDGLLPESFALVRETSKRTLDQRHFDCQLLGGIVLHQGKIAEMKTGEGKTLAATLPVYLNALSGKGVQVVTVNDYLAKRDAVWMGQVYYKLGLSVGCITHGEAFLYDPEYKSEELTEENNERDEKRDLIGGFKVVGSYLRPVSREEVYLADVTYGTNNEFGFDYLKDNMVYDLKKRVQRDFNFAVIDEIDSILIDEARTPLIISSPDVESSEMYGEFSKIIPKLNKENDYEVDEKMKAVTLTEEGVNKIEKILGLGNIYQEKGIRYLHHLEQGLKAEVLFKRDRDYVVKEGQVMIVDEFTGRLLPGRRFSGGLHQALEAKEGVNVRPESLTLASITFQNLFRMYPKLAGMTGTAVTSAEEFDKVYGLEVIIVPTNKDLIRDDMPDQIFKTFEGKMKAVVREIKECHDSGQPVLVGTVSIEKNEYLGKLLEREGIPHNILNAKYHEREGEIIAQAGRKDSVTIATNMAGRGVDIVLGGNPPKEEFAEEVRKVKGLRVIGTERHEARRIDNQLRGRSGRQGDPGSSRFFVSLEDDLLRIFGGDRVKSLMEKFNFPEDQPIEAKIVSGIIESAQGKIEGMNFDIRKHLLDYDDVVNKHREVFYKRRKSVLEDFKNSKLKEKIIEIIKKNGLSEAEYEKKEAEIGEEKMREVEKILSLRIIDSLWMDHLEEMDQLKGSVRLRAYGQRDPLIEYKRESHGMFLRLISEFESSLANALFKVQISAQIKPPERKILEKQNQPQIDKKLSKKPGRNDPCPCGSGKKYKKCCWPKYG